MTANVALAIKIVLAAVAAVCLFMLIATYPDATGHKDELWGAGALLATLCSFHLP